MTEDRKQDMLRKVRGLLDTADSFESGGNSAAAQSYREKAEQLIASWSIQEFELDMANDPRATHTKPEQRDYDYGTFPPEIRTPLIQLFGNLARHCGVKLGVYRYDRAVVVGFPQDIDYLDMLFTSVRLHMSASIRPTASREMGYEASLAILKESGLKWKEIYLKLLPLFPERFAHTVAAVRQNKEHKEIKAYSWNSDKSWEDYEAELINSRQAVAYDGVTFVKEVPRPIGVRFTKEYTTFCEETGRERIYSDPEVWFRSFVEGYTDEIANRLYQMQRAREGAQEGKGLVLVSMKSMLDEFFYELYPEKRPHPHDCDCEVHHSCSDPKCKRTNCRERRKPVRYSAYVAPKVSGQARAAGRRAGSTADLSGGRNTVANRKGELG
jgi:hypothetical protein